MLINKSSKFEENDLVTFKLINSDEIMAKYMGEDETTYTIDDPHFLTPDPNGRGLALLPYLMTGNVTKSLKLQKAHVIIAAPTKEEIRPSFIKSTTGIETPVNKLV